MTQALFYGCPWIRTSVLMLFLFSLVVCYSYGEYIYILWNEWILCLGVYSFIVFRFFLDTTFCPQLHRTRPRIKLKSLAWARHHKERLLFPPKVYAKHVANVRDWKQAATQHKWGGNWDELPYKKGDGTLQNGTHKNTILIPIRSVMASIFLFDTGSPSIFSF